MLLPSSATHVATGFGPVADAFLENFTERGDTGAACSVYLNGELVVDLWAGETARGPWTRDTRSVLFSVSKGITSICILMAVEEGRMRLDAPVGLYWPEFASNGKATTTVRQLLAHQAGLVAPAEPLTASDIQAWKPVISVLERQRPAWAPGSAHAYHPLTFGWLAGEVLRRATGMRPGRWLRERIAEPLGLQTRFGGPLDAPDFAPMGEQLPTLPGGAPVEIDVDLVARAMGMNGAFDGMDLFHTANTAAFLDAEIPAGNLVSSSTGSRPAVRGDRLGRRRRAPPQIRHDSGRPATDVVR